MIDRQVKTSGIQVMTQFCEFAMTRKTTESDRISQINSAHDTTFIAWRDGYKNKDSVAIVSCSNGHVRQASINNIVNHGRSCKECYVDSLRSSEDLASLRMNERDDLRFIKWVDGYKNHHSLALVEFECGHVHSLSAHSIIHKEIGCPSCKKYGYSLNKAGFVYAMVSCCGLFVKVGISNTPRQRMAALSLATPFGFARVALRLSFDAAEALEFEKYIHGKYQSAGMSGFDGATEWMLFDAKILDEVSAFGSTPADEHVMAAG